ncbi:lipopolysaccharide biosynthesis protein [Muricauda sp. 2012CJ35-5]|uniref:Lipopolysaccharide biosynthesis protein n=1 Tax=Flagellimonas spongiicola TaxID=2942208 RepID=A0ABT0PYL6_9FLAO|nr:lipopolysaccharide biosynthesis protein [Allomuricauda spongiicola]MCL6275548.1 lipopolysaccharide biosynthesis protein [Allomuricauda spongiicola]
MSLAKRMFNGIAWSAIEQFSVDILHFVLGIVLARILAPEEYGVIGILLIFIAISDIFIDSGFGAALVQKQNRTEDDKSTVFWFSLLVSFFCYAVLFISAPFVAQFFDIPELEELLKVLALILIINASFTVPDIIFSIALDFKTLAKVSFGATLISGVTAIVLAYSGYGVWALVFQSLIRSSLNAIFTWILVKWKPNWVFSWTSLKSLFKYGSNLLISSLISTTVNHFYGLVIGKVMGPKDLGIYSRGTNFADTAYGALDGVLDSVIFPALSTIQDQKENLIAYTRKIIKATALLIVPLFLLLAILAEPIIRLLLTEKWLPAVPIMQIFCIARMITIISGVNENLLYVIGRTDLVLRQQLLKIGVRVLLLLVSFQYGILFIAIAELIATTIHFFINTYYPGKIMGYGPIKQIKDMLKILSIGLVMALATYYLRLLFLSDIVNILVTGLVGLIIYIAGLRWLKIQEYDELVALTKGFFKNSEVKQ